MKNKTESSLHKIQSASHKMLSSFEPDYKKNKIKTQIETSNKKLKKLALKIVNGIDISSEYDSEDEENCFINKKLYNQFLTLQDKISRLECDLSLV